MASTSKRRIMSDSADYKNEETGAKLVKLERTDFSVHEPDEETAAASMAIYTTSGADDSLHAEAFSPAAADEHGGHLSPGGGKVKRRSSGKEDKLICLVCGDRALGCNFDAISCESCKAFFRRNALKSKPTKCLFEGLCKIDVNTRRFCPHCRLQKCFAVGMKSKFILGESDKKKRMMKVMENRTRRHPAATSLTEPGTPAASDTGSLPASPAPTINSQPATPLPPDPPASILLNPASLEDQPLTVNTAPVASPTAPAEGALGSPVASTGASSPGSTTVTLTAPVIPGVAELLQSGTIAEAIQQAIQMQLTQQTEGMDISNLLSLSKLIKTNESYNSEVDSFLVRRLTQEESSMLNDLMQIYDLSFTVDLEPLVHIKQIDPSLDQLVNQSSITVLRIIKFAKRLEEFVKLPQECQIGILKGCWIHILLLRSVSVYDNVRHVWGTPKGDIPTTILKNATGYVQLHDVHINYCKSIKSIIRDDLTIVVILIVIVLFSPEGPHVMTRELVSNIQDRYLVLLKHYLESKYTYVRAADMFPQLISKMKELKELAEVHGRVLLDVNPSEIEPIMLEILDLK